MGSGADDPAAGGDAGPVRGPRADSADVYGEAWVYESLVSAVPGVDVTDLTAVGVQFVGFEAVLLVLAVGYGLPGALLPGTVAIAVAATGSAFMLDIGRRAKNPLLPVRYRRLLFASGIEVVLGLFAYVALVTYLFVVDPRDGATLLTGLLGERPSVLPAAFALLVLWDVCYRIGTGWWAAVVSLWRSLAYDLEPGAAPVVDAIDRRTLAFGSLQVVLLPFVWGHPLLVVAVAGHVAAVVVVTGASLVARKRRG